jgi:2-oxoglutarate/2-oxoacid ferredoxin oxidoreductase subunit beta
MNAVQELTKKDFIAEGDVKWCPGCGDYSILSSVQTVLPTLGIPKEEFVFISGIGCSSRFPYYMATYGFHTIHGRAPTVASGVKMANPDLSVWMVTGDGDGLSIGANHTMHMMRRNMDLKVMLFNNRIYGLTKGQYSPTSEKGKVTKTSLMGSIDAPLNPVSFAIASGATFVARTSAANPKHLQATLIAAAAHKGTAFIEILQNCNIFNDGAFAKYLNKETKDVENLFLEPGKPLLFDKDTKGIVLDTSGPEPEMKVVENTGDTSKFITHNPGKDSTTMPYLIGQLGIEEPNFPTAMGIIRQVRKPTYDEDLYAQEKAAKEKKGEGSLKDLIYAGDTWTVGAGDPANLDA